MVHARPWIVRIAGTVMEIVVASGACAWVGGQSALLGLTVAVGGVGRFLPVGVAARFAVGVRVAVVCLRCRHLMAHGALHVSRARQRCRAARCRRLHTARCQK